MTVYSPIVGAPPAIRWIPAPAALAPIGALTPEQRGRRPGRIDISTAPSSMERRAQGWSKSRE